MVVVNVPLKLAIIVLATAVPKTWALGCYSGGVTWAFWNTLINENND
jgi:hypothetical protein